jgi:polar amino acid transport system substrate-binding protein
VDAVVADNVPSEGFVGKNAAKIKVVGSLLTSEDYGISVCKNNPELLARINAGLKKVLDAGIIEKLNNKWIRGGVEEAEAAPVEMLKIRVASDAAYPPFEMVDETTKEIIGFDIDLFDAIAKEANLEVEYVNIGFDPLLAGMAQCQYDAAISAITITEERAKNMQFSDPYFKAGQAITVGINNDTIKTDADLKGKSIGTQLGTTGDILAKEIEGSTVKAYDSVDLAFQDLINGQVDAVVADNVPSEGFVGKNAAKIKVVGSLLTSEDYGISVCKNNPELLARINAGLKKVLDAGIIEDLNNKWIKGSGE